MPSVRDLIRQLLPNGTNDSNRGSWQRFPFWPPDAFAVAATLANLSGCYARACYTAPCRGSSFFSDETNKALRGAASEWGRAFEGWIDSGRPTEPAGDYVQGLWDNLRDEAAGVHDDGDKNQRCWDAVLKLLVAADEASGGVGFIPSSPGLAVSIFVVKQHKLWVEESPDLRLKHLPASLCWMVPRGEVCVQPKSRTAQVGCTLRSLTHHLALLPYGEVGTTWSYGVSGDELDQSDGERLQLEHRPFHLLVVPFPYQIDGECFVPGAPFFGDGKSARKDHEKNKWRFFGLDQRWLREGDRPLRAEVLAGFLLDLIEQAKQKVEHVDGLVLPELALNAELVDGVAEALRAKSQLELFISGYCETADGQPSRNWVHGSLFARSGDRVSHYRWKQSKHHRWMLERHQIQRYQLGDRLHPECYWWEDANIEGRGCGFWVFRRICSLTTLVCEDLARIDPVQSVIRSIGPTLVVALLMDGAQLEKRWSARYATVLADDPGSAVLSVTSLGLLRRSTVPGGAAPGREVALWKGAEQETRELRLPEGDHALLLSLSTQRKTNFTLDGRSDDGTTIGLLLSKVQGVKALAAYPWLNADENGGADPRARKFDGQQN